MGRKSEGTFHLVFSHQFYFELYYEMCVMKCVIARNKLFIYFLSAYSTYIRDLTGSLSSLAEREREREQSSIKVEHNYPDMIIIFYNIFFVYKQSHSRPTDHKTIHMETFFLEIKTLVFLDVCMLPLVHIFDHKSFD